MTSTSSTSVRRPSFKRSLSTAAVLALGALALTACQGSGTAAASGTSTSQASTGTTAAPIAAPTGTSGSTGGSTGGSSSTGSTSGSSGGSSSSTGGSGGSTGGSGSGSNSDSYAWTHPCDASQLSVHVIGGNTASRRVIEVRNNGSHACGLSYFPLVYLDNSASADQSHAVKPLVPSGLGGAPAYPVHVGETAYAVIDLDPSGATSGAPGVNELNVLADGNHMPDADTVNFPLTGGTPVRAPKLGLYEDTVSAAVASMTQADTQS
ncbi:DUF4232 domain-containing protein [Streptacidiphilus fuscans]|uniref:DUF4232 domain-containing protein n=1 Tax=Streptacidiphilus fuscans TaxID=2789292 RepID=A0A931B127_9ACTN|nr:DUF4232 domain-containing protein [Streptacidiphilus fuscans]MBF9068293.1 hypothetical protein [Streptacidiphilus fuscans]